MKRILQVLLPILQEKAVFDYHSSEDLELGAIVQVSLRNKELEGIVWSKTRSDDKVPTSKIKDIIRSFPNIALPPQSLKFMKFVSEYNLISLGAVLKLFFPFPNLPLSSRILPLRHPSEAVLRGESAKEHLSLSVIPATARTQTLSQRMLGTSVKKVPRRGQLLHIHGISGSWFLGSSPRTSTGSQPSLG